VARARARTTQSPTALLDAASIEPDAARKGRLLAQAYDAADADELDLASPEVMAEVGSAEGLAQLLLMAVTPTPSPDDALALAVLLSPSEWARVNRAAWGTRPRDEAERAIDQLIGVTWPVGVREPHAMGKAVWTVAEATGWTVNEIGAMTLSQWNVARSGGEPPSEGFDPPTGVSWREMEGAVLRPRERFWAEIESNQLDNDKGADADD
jgi:hypothetical protein